MPSRPELLPSTAYLGLWPEIAVFSMSLVVWEAQLKDMVCFQVGISVLQPLLSLRWFRGERESLCLQFGRLGIMELWFSREC